MGRRRASILLLLGLGLLPALVRAAHLTEVQLAPLPDGTRIVLALAGEVSHTLFTLERPDRVVLDLRATTRAPGLVLPAGQGVVRGLRAGPREAGTLRLVFDVGRRVRPHATLDTTTAGLHRLVLDLEAADAGGGTPVHATPPRSAAADGGATVLAEVAPAAARVLPSALRDLVIAIDAGHGGEDPGATGRDGTREKDVTLAVARALAARANAEPGMHAVLTRSGDYFVPLRERMRRARAARADLFISVHADAVLDRSVAGSSVYVLSARGASSEAAKWLADRENAADLIGGVTLDDKDDIVASVLLDLSQSAAMSASAMAAARVIDQLNEVGDVRRSEVQRAGFVVLKSPDVPSMLIETAYITNPAEEQRLRDPNHQGRLAEAILTGVRNYFRENPPPGTRVPSGAGLRADAAGEARGSGR